MSEKEIPDAPFDAALEGIRQGRIEAALDALVADLDRLRRGSSPEAWNRVVERARAHPVSERILRDPFVQRCFAKPRGYAADGIALDFILRARDNGKSGPAERLHRRIVEGTTGRALRFRRDATAREIDACGARTTRPARVFAAGAGHLRECDRATAFGEGRVGSLVAFDGDAENLENIRRDYPGLPIVPHHGSVREFAEGRHLFGDLDLIYSAGMFEAVPQAAAQGFTRTLFAMLAPGGKLFLTHFLSAHDEAGFLDAFLDWRMVYRNQSELFDLAEELPPETVSTWTYSENSDGTMGVLAIQKR
jgi:hypothetical protein